MKLLVEKTEKLSGEITIPGSKSHTIRAVTIASLAKGVSKIRNPLKSDDTMASVNAWKLLGAKINTDDANEWIIEGVDHKPKAPGSALNMLNSGTSLRIISGIIAALCDFEVELDGDDSLRTRPMQPLLKAYNELGAEALSISNNGYCPIKIKGKMTGGSTEISGLSSQFVTSLLFACPLLEEDTKIKVLKPNEIPYIKMTLRWLDEQGIRYQASEDFTGFTVFGSQKYKPFEKTIPADWSSAAFPLVAGAITNSDITIKGLDLKDTQGDKAIIDYLKKMDADIKLDGNEVHIKGKPLKGCQLDLNSTPDALPALSVLGAFAEGTTTLYNVPQARVKETDRIKVMAEELGKMDVDIKEREEGLIIHKSALKGNKVRGHNDHRVVMALSLAGLIAEGKTEITSAESIGVTYPGFIESMQSLGAKIKLLGGK
ncbi:MAG TPA: 3-phosphoshikimate 1-carboxyvinyltransferase [Candidatus Nanoarchaeia archaeon]|nr:3-phosphoshikimate 1-carboxyvinyltransferase [Candidatus Nanoarchaeia archaeon]